MVSRQNKCSSPHRVETIETLGKQSFYLPP